MQKNKNLELPKLKDEIEKILNSEENSNIAFSDKSNVEKITMLKKYKEELLEPNDLPLPNENIKNSLNLEEDDKLEVLTVPNITEEELEIFTLSLPPITESMLKKENHSSDEYKQAIKTSKPKKTHYMNKIINVSIILIFFLILIASGYYYLSNNNNNKGFLNNQTTTTILSDVKTTTTTNKVIIDKTPELKVLVENFLGDEIDKVGIVYYDINSQNSFEINADIQYFPASVSKLYAVITLYDLAFHNKIDISQEVYYTRSDYEAGSGIMQGMDLTKPYPLTTLAKYAIINSDNIAFHMVSRVVTRDEMRKNYESIIGHSVTRSSNGTMNMSAKDAYLIMKKIYYNDEKNIYYQEFLDSLQNTTATGKTREYLSQYTIARKGGDYQDYCHDATIVYAENPYILTIFTKGLADDADEKISLIAKLIDENR